MVGYKEDLDSIEDDVYKIEGCIRAVLMKKLIDLTDRNEDGTLTGKKRRSVLSGPTLLVIPHELLPLTLAFARVYAYKVIVVIDEFDRILSKTVPRWLAERFQKIGKPKQWPWYYILRMYIEILKNEKTKQNKQETRK